MHIVNIMLGKGRGGLEQVAIDYHKAFEFRGHTVTSIISPNSWVKSVFSEFTNATVNLTNAGQWDPIAAKKLSKIIKNANPDIVICIGNRAIRLALKAANNDVPVVGVAQNHKNKKFDKCDAVFCITKQLVQIMEDLGFPNEKIFHIPNMVEEIGKSNRPSLRTPPVIGSFGRFVEKKGFQTYIEALDILKSRGLVFKAVLGGGGALENDIKKQINQSNLDSNVEVVGWVEDKSIFFRNIDVFVLPSRHEPFGIVLIEAMSESVPCISTNSEGPTEIISNGDNGILFPIDDANKLAAALEQLLFQEPQKCQQLGDAGCQTVESKYTTKVISKLLEQSAERIVNNF